MKHTLTEGETITGNRHTYSIEDHLGAGGLARAWVGVTESGLKYCIKHPNFDSDTDDQTVQEYFNQERRILSDLQSEGGHPNIVDFVESFTVDGLPILVVELIEGEDGFRTIAGGGALEPDTVRSIGIELCDAAMFIHTNEHINRDLKPENFILDHSNSPVLIDFNTARGFDEDKHPEELDARFTKVESRFNPPEVDAPGSVDFRQGPWSDVYSIGKVMFYLLTAGVPSNKHTLDVHNYNTPCPDDLASVIETATQPEYNDRFSNAESLKRALEQRDATTADSATLVRQETGESIDLAPGDTIGREASSSPATITVPDPTRTDPGERSPISSVQVEFDLDDDGKWLLKDRSLNGTWIHHGDSRGWIQVLGEDGRERRRAKGYDPTLEDGTLPPTSHRLEPGDRIVLVHPTFDVSYIFDPE